MSRLEFGLRPPARVRTAWGARAIYHLETGARGAWFDLLWDRQSWKGTDKRRAALKSWLDYTGLDSLREMVNDEILPTNASETLTYVDADAGYTIQASPRRSCGYLYIVAFPTVKEARE